MKLKSLIYDWQDLAFASKQPINNLRAIFIVAPREISQARFKQLIKSYLPQHNIILGLAKEPYVLGFENQPQFRMQQVKPLASLIDKINDSGVKPKIYQLYYYQRELIYLLDQLDFKKVVFINGSWKYALHTQAPYYALINHHCEYELVSPFCDIVEAKIYEANPLIKGIYSDIEMMNRAITASHYSYDYNFQTGVALGKLFHPDKYKWLTFAYNKVVPYQTYAMHHGALRERFFSPPNDLNYYDTIHAEIMLVLKSLKQGIKLSNTTLFTNLMPCPNCTRMLCETGITEIVYAIDHSDGFAVKLLQAAGKKTRRLLA